MPTGLLTAEVVWINQFPDVVADAASGKRTLVVRLGLEMSRWGYLLIWALSYVFIVGSVLLKALPIQALAGLLTLPWAFYVTRYLFRNYRARAIKSAQAGTIYLHLFTGLLMILGVWLAL